jgi:hypothetical protein
MRYLVLGILCCLMTACADSAPAPVHMGTSAGYDYTPRGNYVPPEGFHPVAPANNGYTQQELPPPSQISPQQPLVPDSSSTMDNTQGYHIVTQDETLYSIARSYKTDVRTLINGNNLAAPYYSQSKYSQSKARRASACGCISSGVLVAFATTVRKTLPS